METVPGERPLAPASERPIPPTAELIVEAVHRVPVARQTVVAVVPTEDTAQPLVLRRERRMHPTPLFRPHHVQLARTCPRW